MKLNLLLFLIIIEVVGFSLGDELGFAESIGNLEGGRRRALNYRNGVPNNIGVLPAVKQPSAPVPSAQTVHKSYPIALTPRPKHTAQHRMQPARPTASKRSGTPLMTEAAYLPMGVPAFKPIPPKTEKPPLMTGQKLTIQSNTANVAVNNKVMEPAPFKPSGSTAMARPMTSVPKNLTFVQSQLPVKAFAQELVSNKIPPFQAMPNSLSRVSTGDTIDIETRFTPITGNNLPKVDLMGHTVEELAAAANVSVDAIKQAIAMRQQQLLSEYRTAQVRKQLMRDATSTTTPRPTAARRTTAATTTTTTTTVMPKKNPSMRPTNAAKVMNAPKEYYPVGYDKNFDDNFTSKVDLPPTSFSCGDQKHFPGLYADVDLGCMVFHVCALTDDGLIMKSFLCPESTLFDQTILKCNWWFYVDCKSSQTLYDSNIPISKSYQLMKSLTYFSNYNKNSDKEGIDIEALRNTVVSDSSNSTSSNSSSSNSTSSNSTSSNSSSSTNSSSNSTT